MLDIVNLDELESRAHEHLEQSAFDYLAGGAGDEWTLRENRAAWERFALLPRVLRGVGQRQLDTTVLGTRISFPVLVAPMAFHGLCDTDAETATVRGVAGAGTIFVASTMSNHSIETIAQAVAPALCWFQLYIHRDRGITTELVHRAEAAGYGALCLTVDTPMLGNRERDGRNRLRLPDHLELGNFTAAHGAMNRVETDGSAVANYVRSEVDPGLVWADLDWLRSITALPIVVKGVLHPEDATLAVAHGAASLVVSNHGGRQLDGVPAPITMLDAIVDRVGGRAEVLLDGGVRRGTDVLKALALGARAVMVGRPVLWGLALGGSEGVRAVLDHLRGELDLAMALAGCSAIGDIRRELVV